MEEISAIILAAGEGKRMKSNKSTVLHKICEKTLVQWVYDSVVNAGINDCIMVVGHKADQVKAHMGDKVKFAMQERQQGTGHAVMQAQEYISGKQGYVIILNGDTPLIEESSIRKVIDYHKSNSYDATLITTELENATGYGRIVRNTDGAVVKIVEHKDANEQELSIKEINSGMYCLTIDSLLDSLKKINNDNSQGEYYLTDTIEILIRENFKVGALKIDDSTELLGINDRVQLAEVEAMMRKRILNNHMKNGVTIIDPSNTYISADVQIGMDTIIYPGCVIEEGTKIGEECVIGPNTRIVESILDNNIKVQYSVVLQSSIGQDTTVGPFAYLRPGSKIGQHVKIGDFVEVKNSIIGNESKIPHLTYVGDSEVGKNVNLGCGTITVNYDGKKKFKTTIGDNVFVGCNSNLVAPVVVNDGAYIAAGSTITDEVPSGSLAIGRQKQIVKEGWVNKKFSNK